MSFVILLYKVFKQGKQQYYLLKFIQKIKEFLNLNF